MRAGTKEEEHGQSRRVGAIEKRPDAGEELRRRVALSGAGVRGR
jgi:hypothetical protein